MRFRLKDRERLQAPLAASSFTSERGAQLAVRQQVDPRRWLIVAEFGGDE